MIRAEYALVKGLSQGWPVTGDEPTRDLVRELVSVHDTRAAVARLLRVPESRVRRWAATGKASDADRARLLAAVRDARLPSAVAEPELTGGFEHVEFDGLDHHGKRSAPRLQLRPGTLSAVADAYVAGDVAAALDALIDGMVSQWYREQYRLGVHHERAREAGLPSVALPDWWWSA